MTLILALTSDDAGPFAGGGSATTTTKAATTMSNENFSFIFVARFYTQV